LIVIRSWKFSIKINVFQSFILALLNLIEKNMGS
jgi:hypothetical protein